eukprot:12937655-Prorocentrum_lima.AAC.1
MPPSAPSPLQQCAKAHSSAVMARLEVVRQHCTYQASPPSYSGSGSGSGIIAAWALVHPLCEPANCP